MKPFALLINDIHVSKDNLSEFENNWFEALDICKERGIIRIIIGGDLFTTRSAQTLSTLLSVQEALTTAKKRGIEVILAEGNHDKVNQEAIEGYCHIFSDPYGITVVDTHEVIVCSDGGFGVLVMSYFPETGSFLERLETAVYDALSNYSRFIKSKEDIILYIHQGIHGALGDMEIPGELPQEPLLGFKAVLCGHYHNRTKIKGTNIEYIGSSRQHNFGEDEDKGYTIIHSDGSHEFVKNQVNTRYKTVTLSADEADSYNFEDDSRYKMQVKILCDDKSAKLIDKQKFLDMGFDKVEVKLDKLERSEAVSIQMDEKFGRLDLINEYYEYCKENDINNSLGVKYLEGKSCGDYLK